MNHSDLPPAACSHDDHGSHGGHGAHGAHAHGHSHGHGTPNFDRAFAVGIALNLAFVIVEAFYGWQADSLALLADAGHNLSDVAGLVLAWAAAFAGRLRPTHRLTYGWQRASILAALANAMLLLLAMGALVMEAVMRLRAPEPIVGMTLIVVAAIGVLVNGLTAALFMAGRKSDLNIRGAFQHMAADALVSLGVVVAGVLYLYFGWEWLDPLVSLVIALVIVAGTWGLLRESLHLAFDGVPDAIDLIEVNAWLHGLDGVTGVHDLHVWAIGSAEVALTAHLVMPAGHPGDAFFSELAREAKRRFSIRHPTIQIEIDGIDDGCVRPIRLN